MLSDSLRSNIGTSDLIPSRSGNARVVEPSASNHKYMVPCFLVLVMKPVLPCTVIVLVLESLLGEMVFPST